MYSNFPFDRSNRKPSGRAFSGQFPSTGSNRRWLLSGLHPAHATPGPHLDRTGRAPLGDLTAASLGQSSDSGTANLDDRGLDVALQSVSMPTGMIDRLHQLVDELPEA